MMMMTEETNEEDYKENGNRCVKEKLFNEAIVHYSKGLRKNRNDHILYSNRSFAYFNLKLYYYALCDADKVIELRPDWSKGYFRKAEVLKKTFQLDDALINYGRALKLDPNNTIIINHFKTTAKLCSREIILENNVPWVCSAIGLVIGCSIVILDTVFTKNPTLRHPLLMVLMVMIAAFVGWIVGKVYRYYLKLHRKGLVDLPSDMSDDFLLSESNNSTPDSQKNTALDLTKKRLRYTKSQARLRMKKS